MADPYPPTTTTVITSTTTTTKTGLHLDYSYLHTFDGKLKIIRMLLDLLGFICICVNVLRYHPRGSWFNTVAMGGFWFTGIMLCLYLFHVTEKLRLIPWVKVEFFFCSLWTIFYLIAAALVADMGVYENFAAAAFFGFCAMIAYGYDAFQKYSYIRGNVVVTRTEETVQNNHY